MISDFWELKTDALADRKTLAAWGAVAANFSQVSQSVDVLTLDFPRDDFGSDELWSYKDEVTLYRDDVVFFRGRATLTPRTSKVMGDFHRYEFHNVMARLDGLLYRQTWDASDGAGGVARVASARVMLGADDDTAELLTTRATLAALVAYASGLGVTVGLDASRLPEMKIPVLEANNKSVGQLIRDVLRWHPDAMTRVKYEASGVTLICSTRETAAAIELDAAGQPLSEIDIVSRPDMVPDSVHVAYEGQEDVVHTPASGITQTKRVLTLDTDVFPVAATATEDSLYLVLPAPIPSPGSAGGGSGGAAQNKPHAQPVRTRVLPRNGASGEVAKKWWFDHMALGSLGLNVADLILPTTTVEDIYTHSIELIADDVEEPPSAVNPNSTPVYSVEDVGDLPRELVSGAVADWMDVKVQRVMATTTLAIKVSAIRLLSEKSKEWLRGESYRDYKMADGERVLLFDFSAEIDGTDALTKVYSQNIMPVASGGGGVSAAEPVEYVIPDLARLIYESRKELHFEGSYLVVSDEITAVMPVGSVLNIFHDSRAEWATMRALIQRYDADLSTGRGKYHFGPPGHLNVQDWQELSKAAEALQASRGITAGGGGPRTRSGGGLDPSGDEDKAPVVGASRVPASDSKVRGPKDPLKPWDIALTDDGYRLIPGEVLLSRFHLGSNLAIANVEQEFDINAVEWLYLKLTNWTTTPVLTLIAGAQWTEYQEAYKVNYDNPGAPELTWAIYPLWHFQTGAIPAYTPGRQFGSKWGKSFVADPVLSFEMNRLNLDAAGRSVVIPNLKG